MIEYQLVIDCIISSSFVGIFFVSKFSYFHSSMSIQHYWLSSVFLFRQYISSYGHNFSIFKTEFLSFSSITQNSGTNISSALQLCYFLQLSVERRNKMGMHFYNGEVENVLHCFKIHLFRSGQTMATVPATVLNALYNETSRDIQEWLAELTMSTEPECIYVLYAKSFLDESEQQQHSSDHCENQTEEIHFDRTRYLP